MNFEKTAIKVLAVSAVLLALALVFIPASAPAQVSVQGGDYLVSTFTSVTGNDAIYIADTRAGAFAVFAYDPAARTVVPRVISPLGAAFGVR